MINMNDRTTEYLMTVKMVCVLAYITLFSHYIDKLGCVVAILSSHFLSCVVLWVRHILVFSIQPSPIRWLRMINTRKWWYESSHESNSWRTDRSEVQLGKRAKLKEMNKLAWKPLKEEIAIRSCWARCHEEVAGVPLVVRTLQITRTLLNEWVSCDGSR